MSHQIRCLCFTTLAVFISFISINLVDQSMAKPFEQTGAVEFYGDTYREQDMKETGTMQGFEYSAAYRNGFLARFEGRYCWGNVNYEYLGGNPKIPDIPDSTIELRVIGGYDFPVFGSSVLTPYVGFGHRYLNDSMQEKYSTFPKRESRYYYAPIGMEIATRLGNNSSIGAIVEYDAFLGGQMYSMLSYEDPGYDDAINEQRYGFAGRWALMYRTALGGYDLEMKLFERFWQIESSEQEDCVYNGVVIGKVWEPKNNTVEMGISAALRF